MPTLVASHGPALEMNELRERVVCPKCGSRHVALSFHAPAKTNKGEVGDPGHRRMRPAQDGEGTLGSCRELWIIVICAKCNRRGEYRRETLLAKYGPDVFMPSLHERIAADSGCAQARNGLEKPDNSRPFPCDIKFDIDMSGLV